MQKHRLRFTLITTACLAGSVLLWQAMPRHESAAPHTQGRAAATRPPSVIHAALGHGGLANYTLNAVAFANNSRGWIAGNGIILGTTNGGMHFSPQYRGPLDLIGIQALSASDAVAYNHNAVLETNNGGRSWTTVRQSGAALIQVDFISLSKGFAIRGAAGSFGGKLYRTTDGGRAWRPVPGVNNVTSVTFADASTGWAGVGNAVYRTTDGGAVWTRVARLPGLPGYARLDATGAHHVWMFIAGGSGMSQTSYSIFASTDGVHFKPVLGVSTAGAGPAPGGATHANPGPGSSPGPFVAVSNSVAYVAGECEACGAGTITFAKTVDGGRTWTQYPTIPDVPGLPSWIGGGSAMAFPSASEGWLIGNMVGVSNRLYHTVDGGRTWSQAYPAITPTGGFNFVSPTTGFGLGVAGNANAVLKTTDGGAVWQIVGHLPVTSAPPYHGSASLLAIQFVSVKRGFAVGSNSLLYGTVDGGRSWNLVRLPFHPSEFMYSNLWFANAHSGVFVVNQGASNRVSVYVTTNGGVTWKPMRATGLQAAQTALLPSSLLRSMSGKIKTASSQSGVGTFGPRIAWVYTYGGCYLTTDGGGSWTLINFPSTITAQPDVIQFTSAKDGFAQFLDGNIYRTTDGGYKWSLVTTG